MENQKPPEEFEPRIIAFLCNWCSYAGADLAGVSRYQYPTGVRVIRVMCSGRIDPFLVFRAFRRGADGVLVAGCHIGDCHYISGNLQTQERVKLILGILEKNKIPPQRFKLAWVSASEGKIFSQIITEFNEELRKLGPISQEAIDGLRTMKKMAASERVFLDFPVRYLIGKGAVLAQSVNVYGERVEPDKLKNMAGDFVRMQSLKHLILEVITNNPTSLIRLSKTLETSPKDIFECLVQLKTEGQVDIVGFEEDYPVFLHRGVTEK